MKKNTEKISAGTVKNLMPRREMLARVAQGGLTGAALLGMAGAAGAARPKKSAPHGRRRRKVPGRDPTYV